MQFSKRFFKTKDICPFYVQLLTSNNQVCIAMVYDRRFASYVEKLAWDPSVYVNTPAVFCEKKTPGQSVPIPSGSPAFGFALRVIVERPAKRPKYARFV
jgi:hypothetical protein